MIKTMKPLWPTYSTIRKACCFNCDAPVQRPHVEKGYETDNPPGHGAMRGWCPECELYTWFDLTASHDVSRQHNRNSGEP